MHLLIRSRQDGGRQLARKLNRFKGSSSTRVISIPRGGVVVGAEIAEYLRLPHDVVTPRRIPESRRSEWSIGAVADNGIAVWDRALTAKESPAYLKRALQTKFIEARRYSKLFRGRHGPRDVEKKTVILVDDGIHHGWTMEVAIAAMRAEGAEKIIVAAPVCSKTGLRRLKPLVDGILYLHMPYRFQSIGRCYRLGAFDTVEEAKVVHVLSR
jgi:putative phosphoribosyl transferase